MNDGQLDLFGFVAPPKEPEVKVPSPDCSANGLVHFKYNPQTFTFEGINPGAGSSQIDYAIKRDRAADPPRFLIFFKARDEAAITAAFTEFSANKVRKASRPSVLQKLSELSAKIKTPVKAREKYKEPER